MDIEKELETVFMTNVAKIIMKYRGVEDIIQDMWEDINNNRDNQENYHTMQKIKRLRILYCDKSQQH